LFYGEAFASLFLWPVFRITKDKLSYTLASLLGLNHTSGDIRLVYRVKGIDLLEEN